ncbi:unnamed protein product (mitochondrion) [Plasmodiophora brassicae]|uniref:MI domain-containing protein n=2 Tax=Plasmodiophora brassicae TaxID=37360 RepID=A0A3P3YB63_PLABS|nr:unnamed protein product [Plasmodiophora brassicae]
MDQDDGVGRGVKRSAASTGRAGGVYVPPFKAAQAAVPSDPSTVEYQRAAWDALRKSINGLVNKVNTSNIANIVAELFAENIIRGRGLLVRAVVKAQMASPNFTPVYAALIAVINTKMPEIGELLMKRMILQFRRAYRRNDKIVCLACTKFLAHLVNQQVAHEIVALELLTLLLDKPTDDSVEVAVGFITDCGAMLTELSPRGIHAIFERFRGILHEGEIDKRVQYMIEGLFVIRRGRFADHPAVPPELDLVESADQISHELILNDDHDPERSLDIFHFDPEYTQTEAQYDLIKAEIIGDEELGADGEPESEEEEEEEEAPAEANEMEIIDETGTKDVTLRRTIYLTIMSSLDFEECAHKLLKTPMGEGKEPVLCEMVLECCAQERSYMRFYGLLGERFCRLKREFEQAFEELFARQYATVHRHETSKLRNIAKFFAHLLQADALDWSVLEYISLTETDTTSSSRIFIKIVFQELSEVMGLKKLRARLNDPAYAEFFSGLFPKDSPKNTRFAINFFTSIGLGGLTDELRAFLKVQQVQAEAARAAAAADGDEGSSDVSSDSSDSDTSSDASSSDVSSDGDSSDDQSRAGSSKRARRH